MKNYKIEEKTIKSIKFKGKRKAHNLSVNRNKNFILANGLVTHNTSSAFSALRNPINKYSDHSRFIITCNTVSKLPSAIQSRFEQGSYLFKQVPMDLVQEHCEYILQNEEIDYNIDDVKYLINNLYPDIRKIVSRLQKCSYAGKLQIGSEDVKTKENQVISNVVELIDMINNNEKNKIGTLIQNISELVDDPALEFSTIYKNLFYNSKIRNPGIKIKVNQYANTHNSCLSPSMHFMSLVFSILEVLKQYG